MRKEDIVNAYKLVADQDIMNEMIDIMKCDDIEFRSYNSDMTMPLSYISPNRRASIRNKIIQVLQDEVNQIDKLIEKI